MDAFVRRVISSVEERWLLSLASLYKETAHLWIAAVVIQPLTPPPPQPIRGIPHCAADDAAWDTPVVDTTPARACLVHPQAMKTINGWNLVQILAK